MDSYDDLEQQLNDPLREDLVSYVNSLPEIIDINKKLESNDLSEEQLITLNIDALKFILKLQEDHKITIMEVGYIIIGFLSIIITENKKMPEILDSIFAISSKLEIPYHHNYKSKDEALVDFLKLKDIINNYKIKKIVNIK